MVAQAARRWIHATFWRAKNGPIFFQFSATLPFFNGSINNASHWAYGCIVVLEAFAQQRPRQRRTNVSVLLSCGWAHTRGFSSVPACAAGLMLTLLSGGPMWYWLQWRRGKKWPHLRKFWLMINSTFSCQREASHRLCIPPAIKTNRSNYEYFVT